MNPVTILWWKGGHLTGTLSIGQRNWQLKSARQQRRDSGVVETVLERLPDEHPRMPPERMQRLNLDRDTMHAHGDGASMRPRRGEIEHLKDDAARPGVAGGKVALAPPDHGIAQTPRDAAVSIDVLVVYTARAAAHFADIRRDLVETPPSSRPTSRSDRAGSATSQSGWRVRRPPPTTSRARSTSITCGAWSTAATASWRKCPRCAIASRPISSCSSWTILRGVGSRRAWRRARIRPTPSSTTPAPPPATRSRTRSAISSARATTARSTRATSPFAWGHGYVSPDRAWRTMMGHPGGLQRLSAPADLVDPGPRRQWPAAGDELTDNARVIRESAARAAAFR